MGFITQLGAVLQWDIMLLMILAVIIGIVIGILPGLGGSVALALLIPMTFGMSPEAAIVILISAYGSVTYGGSMTSILVNTPGEATSAATTFDGYPLMKQGKGGLAIVVAVICSALGGIVGFIILDLLIPVARGLVLAFSFPEFFMLSFLGLTVIAVVTRENTFKGLIAALIGLIIAFIGTDPILGNARLTFGTDYLWDGIPLIPLVIGIFAISEAFNLYKNDETFTTKFAVKNNVVVEGFKTVFSRFWLFLRSCLIGVLIGIIPGVGGSVASFMAYGSAVQTSKNPEKFGKGAIEGVIAPESANDSKEGGALLPTLAFGIPGSVGMAVFIGGLVMHGFTPGPKMLTTHIDIVYFMIAAAIVSKVVALVISLLIGPKLAFVTKIRGSLIAPGVIVLSLVGAYTYRGNFGDVVLALIFGIIGMLMVKYSFSRIPFIIAVVLGGLVESSFYQTMITHGIAGFFTRPITLVLLLLCIASLGWPLLSKKIAKKTNGGA
ncbi:tripartite tricarboxylate transporter permease [Bacillus sp. Marseille-P3661]|uniref:tripartite tricarboxylate transporter permease n=1 Tax=Bacillus sp. Marseille-P3661 TaxID=1936234 RepID=UPI000C85A208|nr:tripartite tricarboxylate transporter permease [Bacillus sp. Marseille-P3661]